MRSLLGTKGANLAEMMQIGLPVPFGFTITAEACATYFENGCKMPEEMVTEIFDKIKELEDVTGKTFGGGENPLLVSVRTGSAVYVPGLAETMLNVGMNDEVAAALGRLAAAATAASADSAAAAAGASGSSSEPGAAAEARGAEPQAAPARSAAPAASQPAGGAGPAAAFAADTYARFRSMYTEIVLGGQPGEIPQDARAQLLAAIEAAFQSWNCEKAASYRAKEHLDPEMVLGVATNIQAMVFGNLGEKSAVGIATTRNCMTGEKKFTGSFVQGTQGNEREKSNSPQDITALEANFPKAYESLQKIAAILEKHYKCVQSMEFTIENGKLYMLQTSEASMSTEAALRIAVDMATEELITPKTAILRQEPEKISEIIAMIKAGGGKATELKADYDKLMEWVDEVRELRVRVNADTGSQALRAARLGAEGIGLCRTENLILASGEMPLLEELLRMPEGSERTAKLRTLKNRIEDEFEELFRIMGDRPVTIRLFDLPVTLRDIAAMQTQAIVEAACTVSDELEHDIIPEILVPMISTATELRKVKATILEAAKHTMEKLGKELEIQIGAMIETPRAALVADKIAAECDFFSFGTNDLTQMVFGISRDSEATGVIATYVDNGILRENPFKTLDINGVGRLMELAAKMGKHEKARLKLGICGAQASDARSIEFCHKIGMNYLSCPPDRVPAAKLAAAQAAVKFEQDEEK